MHLTTVVFLMFAFYAGLTLLMMAANHFVKFDRDKILRDLKRFIQVQQWDAAKDYIGSQLRYKAFVKELLDKLLDAAPHPHRLLLVYEESMSQMSYFGQLKALNVMGWASRVFNVLYVVVLGVVLYMAETEPTGWMQLWLLGWVIAAYVQGIYLSRMMRYMLETRTLLCQIRNEIYAAHDYVPPEYRPLEVSSDQLAEWREAITQIELDILAGADIEDASSRHIRRIREACDHRALHPDEDPLPTSKLSLLGQD